MVRRLRAPLLLIPALAAVLVVAAYGVAFAEPQGAAGARLAFHDQMRKLREDHNTCTRLFNVSAATETGDLPDVGPTADRLLANQVDIGNAIKPFYGQAAGDRLTALLREHILTAADILSAAKAGDEAAVATARAAWYANADEIASFLSTANPKHWPLDEMRAMMRTHLDLTLDEAVARLQGRYADDIAAYEAVHTEILEMADMLSSGIVAQFPSRFAS
jgi:hypothetical protein